MSKGHRIWGMSFFCIVALLAMNAVAQSNKEDGTPASIEAIGVDMINLLDGLVNGERDPTVRLPLDPVIQNANTAVASSPNFLEAQASLDLLQAQRAEIEAETSPKVSASGGFGQRSFESASASGGTTNTTGQYLSQSIIVDRQLYDFGSNNFRLLANKLKMRAVEAQIDDVRGQMTLEAISAFYSVQRSLLQLRLARENLQSRKTFVNFIRERANLGASSSADVVRAESRVADALDLMSAALRNLSRAQAEYRQFYAEEATPYALPREIPVIDMDLLYLNDYLARNPTILMAEHEVQAAKHSLDAIKSSEKGVLSLEGSYGYTKNPGSNKFLNDRKIGLTFSRQLYSGGVSEARVSQAQASLRQAELSLQKARIEVSREIRDAFSDYQGNVAAVDARMLVFNGAKDSYSITKELYAFSRISLFEVLSAQEQLFNSGRQLIDSIIDRAVSKYQLLHITYELQGQLDYFGK